MNHFPANQYNIHKYYTYKKNCFCMATVFIKMKSSIVFVGKIKIKLCLYILYTFLGRKIENTINIEDKFPRELL
jgi:hypothetical protein